MASTLQADRGGPMMGAVCWQRLWLGGKIGQEQCHTALPADTTAPYLPTYGIKNEDCGMGWGTFRPGDICWNKPIPGTPSVPICWRAKRIGSHEAHYNWCANTVYEVGTVIRPQTAGDPVYVVAKYGTTSSGPDGDTGVGTHVVWEWAGVYRDTSFWEPVIASLPMTLTKDVSRSGPITLTADESAHNRIKFTGTLTSDTTVFVEPGGALGWTKTIHNATSGAYTLTIKSTANGAGVVVNQNKRMLLDSDSADVVAL